MPIPQNPCRACELLHEDKGNPTCKACQKRIDYVESIGGMAYSVPVEFTNLIAKKGVDVAPHSDILQKRPLEGNGNRRGEKKICKKCNKRPVIHPNSPYCSQCLNEMGKKAREAKQKEGSASKNKNKGDDKLKPERPASKANTAITIEFDKHVTILEEIETLADQEFRPINLQIIFILRKYLDNIQINKGL